jgi:hypothetical protein
VSRSLTAGGERKHEIAEEYLAERSVGPGVFMVLIARAAATVWDVQPAQSGRIRNLAKKTSFVNCPVSFDMTHSTPPDLRCVRSIETGRHAVVSIIKT